MSLIDQVTRLFQRGRQERRTTASGLEDATSLPLGMAPESGRGGNRLAAYADIERLDAECAEASAALDTIASLISAAPEGEETPFRVEWDGNPPAEAREAIEGVVRRAHLGPKTFAFARDAAKYGDNFLEVVLNDALEVERLKHLPARQIYREEGSRRAARPGVHATPLSGGHSRGELPALAGGASALGPSRGRAVWPVAPGGGVRDLEAPPSPGGIDADRPAGARLR